MNTFESIKHFLKSPPFQEGLKTTIAIIIPIIIGIITNQLHYSIPVAIGAIIASIPDGLGAYPERKKTLFIIISAVLLLSFISQITYGHPIIQGLLLPILSFVCCMLALYGTRALGLGSALLLIFFFNISLSKEGLPALFSIVLLTTGALWYMFFILVVYRLGPHKVSQQALGECCRKVGELMMLKAGFFDRAIAIELQHKAMIQANISLVQSQQEVRELLFSQGQISTIGNEKSRQLNFIFLHVMDLFERINATHYDYHAIREKYGDTESFHKIFELVTACGRSIQQLSLPIKSLKTVPLSTELSQQWKAAHDAVLALEARGQSPTAFYKILSNLEFVISKIQEIKKILTLHADFEDQTDHLRDKEQFFLANTFTWQQFKSHLTLKSAIFRHAIRVSIVMFVAFLIIYLMPLLFPEYIALTEHTFWIYITILVILRPGFSVSKQRSIDRIKGTLIGGLIALLSIYFIKNDVILLMEMLLFMLLAFSFLRHKYLYGSLFLTACFLIAYYYLLGSKDFGMLLFKERVLDTLIGCGLSFISFYFILPIWESNSLKRYMQQTLDANRKFLELVLGKVEGASLDLTTYKLVRMDVYIKQANINSLYDRILQEPKSKRPFIKELTQFLLQSHLMSSYTIALSNGIQADLPISNSVFHTALIEQIKEKFDAVLAAFDHDLSAASNELLSLCQPINRLVSDEPKAVDQPAVAEDLLTEQLLLIDEIITQISKSLRAIREKSKTF